MTPRKHDSQVSIKDILDPNLDPSKRVVKNFSDLKKIVKNFKTAGFKIVLTQGVWDLIHEGHAAYLQKAREHGDILIVGIDSDELTRQRKGPRRPIVPQSERIRMLSHLRHVDVIVLRESHQDIGELVRVVAPDVFVVSQTTKDFTKSMKESYGDVCGEIVDLKHQATTTTSARIRNLAIEGAEDLANEIGQLIQKFLNGLKK